MQKPACAKTDMLERLKPMTIFLLFRRPGVSATLSQAGQGV